MALNRVFKLANGYTIPALGLGTWQSKPHEVEHAVKWALQAGYRHIDAAWAYLNENEVGEGIRQSGVPRSEIFITSKLWNFFHKPEDVEEAVDQSLRELGTDYLDLYLIHWPVALQRYREGKDPSETWVTDPKTGLVHVIDVPIIDTWRELERLVEKGKIRSIGVSNFTREKIEDLFKQAKIRPVVNQIEAHAYLQQQEFVDWMHKENIVVEAYSPLGQNIYGYPRVIDDPTVIQIAKDLGKSPAQVLISWTIQRGEVVLPKSVTKERIEENFQDFILPDDIFQKINALERNTRYNFPAKSGVDIFGEKGDAWVKQYAKDWAEANKRGEPLP